MFKIIKTDNKTRARLGVLTTPHGIIKTPSYVFVGTYGHIRNLSPADIKKTGTQIIISNTYHLWDEAVKVKNSKLKIKNFGSLIHNKFGMKLPIMTDSGGFQVLSLAFGDKSKIGPEVDVRNMPKGIKGEANSNIHFRVGKFLTDSAKINEHYKRKNVKITAKGVYFKYDEKWKFLGPELSIKLQQKIGADIIFAFDHITSPLDTYAYNKKALELTDKWAKICLKEHTRLSRLRQGFGESKQMLFGIVQGGLFKDLRIKSAKSIGSMPFDGFGIGGSYTKKQIAKVLKWIIPHLPQEKPRHLLGVGKVDDIFEAIGNGVDTFDCVIPTREARHGRLYTKTGHIDIRRGYYAKDKPGSRFSDSAKSGKAKLSENSLPGKKVIESGCKCPTCSVKIPRWKIRELIKSPNRKLNSKGQRWCLMHNMWFFNNLLEEIRASIAKGRFAEFKNKFLANFDT